MPFPKMVYHTSLEEHMAHLSSGSFLGQTSCSPQTCDDSLWTSPASLGDSPPAPAWRPHLCSLEVNGHLPLTDEARRHLQLPKGVGLCRFFWLISEHRQSRSSQIRGRRQIAQTKYGTWEKSRHYWPIQVLRKLPFTKLTGSPKRATHLHSCR